jgi:DNA-binding transcriptional regulator LsrR (DeoR family)
VEKELHKLIYRIAKSYYDDEMTQQEIGKKYGLSRIKVNRLLSRAREEGIVQITILPPEVTQGASERQIEAKYGIKEVIIVPSGNTPEQLFRNLGDAGASYFRRVVTGHETVGITWGRSIHALVGHLSVPSQPGTRVVQLIGGLGDPDADIYGTELARRFAEILQSRLRIIPSPGVVANSQVREALFQDHQVADTLKIAGACDVAFVGIGTFNDRSVLLQAQTILKNEEVERLKAKGAVGDVALRFFDSAGRPVEDEINSRIVGLDLSTISRIPRVVGIAGGPEKTEAVKAALTGKLINVLVTDQKTAEKLM